MKVLKENCMQMHRLITILCFLLIAFTVGAAAASVDPYRISINCGGAPTSVTALSGRKWSGDAVPKGTSKTSTVKGQLTAVDPVPYGTARISRSPFSYSFRLTPGQKFIRLHFNPVSSYHGFQSFNDLFTVRAGPFTLLANFSASITARALSLNVVVKEFCIIAQQNQPLNLVFSPETSQSNYNHAFINGIEIISLPSPISYCHGGESAVHVLGQKSVIYVDKTTALERVYHQTMKWGSVLDDMDGMLGMSASYPKEHVNEDSNFIWRVSVDVGFRYLVRIHLCQLGIKLDFGLLIDNMIALTNADILQQGENQSILWYNYMVMVDGHKQEGKRSISISLNSKHEILDRHGPLEGLEVLKLSNLDRSLASPNPLPPERDSPPHTIQTLLNACLGRGNAIATLVFTMICLVNITVHFIQKMWGADSASASGSDMIEEESKPSARAKQLCRSFTLAEIQSATDDFHGGFIVGKGGYGIVYKGFIDNGREIVALKRSKTDSKQGEIQFWTEVETLSELRHVNIVSLIGYCIEQNEMILVYEYMPNGTLADHLYKLARKSKDFYPLSWKQRLKICIGASRGLDYLHTGHGIVHRDVKASNILLDENFVAKVSDFGLAKSGSFSESQSQDSTNLKGTYGYIDPNYFTTRKLTKESDMYSFGVVLLEVLCGRAALEPWNEEEDKQNLTTWAIDNLSKGQVDHIVVSSLRGEISKNSLKTFVMVARRCLHDEPKKRPAAARVVIELELALQRQEKAESMAPKEITSFEDVLSSIEKSQKENINLILPNEKINAANNVSPSQVEKMLPQPSLRIFTFAELRVATKKFRADFVVGEGGFGKVPAGHMLPHPNLRVFSLAELKAATRNFRSDSVLGEGGFGKVYKGWLDDRASGKTTIIAVKKLNSETMQGFEEWKSEVNFLGRLSHPNLVKLLGYGWEEKELLLVYEFMAKGSLENHLFGMGASIQPLPWDIRLKILIGAARGLAFLHASDRKIFYRDFKASNILLDGSYNAKISDFGLARMGPTASKSHVTTQVMGTYGYAAPEYVATCHLSVKSDVYGFGVVLVEMLTGLRAYDTNRPSAQYSIADWIKPHLSDRRKLKHIMDARLEKRYPNKSALHAAHVALTCLEVEPKSRPSMQAIVETLERISCFT